MHDALPSPDMVPKGQYVHVAAPADENAPRGHLSQGPSDLARSMEVPASQLLHALVFDAGVYLPTGQERHLPSICMFRIGAAISMYCPFGQPKQGAPVSENLPDGHT